MSDRFKVQRKKPASSDFTNLSLVTPVDRFNSLLEMISSQNIPVPQSHDISRISLRPQAKLTVSQPGDFYEQEADKVAQQVMNMGEPVDYQKSIQRETVPQEEEDDLQMKPVNHLISPVVQREEIPDEEKEEEELLQMKSSENLAIQREEIPNEEEEEEKNISDEQNFTPVEQPSTPSEQSLALNYTTEDGAEVYVPPSQEFDTTATPKPEQQLDGAGTGGASGMSSEQENPYTQTGQLSGISPSDEPLERDVILEQAAHVLAYENTDKDGKPINKDGKPITDPDELNKHEFAKKILEDAGYDVSNSHTVQGEQGFAMRSFTAANPDAKISPIVAFRGTEPTDFDDLGSDLNAQAIGRDQFMLNQELIAKEMDVAAASRGSSGQVTTTGHSLGGAHAQMAAVNFPDLVGNVTTFQSARISRDAAQQFNVNNDSRRALGMSETTSTHHRIAGDIVPLAGDAVTKGEIRTYELARPFDPTPSPLGYHMAFPVTTRAVAKGQGYSKGESIPGAEQYVTGTTFSTPTVTSTEKDTGAGIVEHGRRQIGTDISKLYPERELEYQKQLLKKQRKKAK
ncbi:hypothetical protein [Scytonema sp. NUACC26]|uniref:hypothetical protein n=1 Tax=Scytonema sp. NUACC26 TaxID=3140176 RepID=UPI0034DBD468